MRPFLSVYGHVSIDQIISVKEFPEDNTSVDVLEKTVKMGGTATNIAVIAASLGTPTAVCAFVGTDFPKEFEDTLKEKKVMIDELIKLKDHYTSMAMIINNSNMVQKVLFMQGPQGCASTLGMELTKNAKRSEYVHFSTGEPRYYLELMDKLRGHGKIVFDPAQEIHEKWSGGLFEKAFERSDILFCNEFEARSVMRYLNVDEFSKIRKEIAICTKGSKGSEAYFDGRKVEVPVIRSERVKDPTGAGDAYRAGFYSGLFRKYSPEESLIIASATSSFIVEAVGALSNIPTWDEVMERADRELTRIT